MISYIIRRMLLMIPTLFGITVMVFLLARLAPGTPATTQVDPGQMTAEAQKAIREWYEKRYGLDLPLHLQYVRWWKGMFATEIEATAWTDERTARPVFTFRRPVNEYFLLLPATADLRPDGRWRQVVNLQIDSARVVDASQMEFGEFDPQRFPDDWELAPPHLPDYAAPRHAIVEGDLHPVDGGPPIDLLRPVRSLNLPEVQTQAKAWASMGAGSVFPLMSATRDFAEGGHDPRNPDEYLFQMDGEWFRLLPRDAPEVWTTHVVGDAGLRREMGSRYADLPPERDGYAIPRHVLVRGTMEPVSGTVDESNLRQVTVPRPVSVPTLLWMRVPGMSEIVPVLERAEPIPILLVRNEDGAWRRYIGESRVEAPDFRMVRQDDESFLRMLTPQEREQLPRVRDDEEAPYHALLSGREIQLHHPVPEFAVRRHRQKDEIFAVTLGTSAMSHTTVMEELKRRLPVTLLISLIAFPLIYLIAIPTGTFMAVKRGKGFDTGSNVILLGLWSIPIVLSATLFIGYLGQGGIGLELFPVTGLSGLGAEAMPFFEWLGDRIWHLVLPVLCIVYGGCAYLAKQMRAAMLDNFTMDYVRTAKAKGVPFKDIVFRHVLRNSLLPIITIFATVLPVLIAGSVIIEKIFTIEGMGLFTFEAVQNRDYDVVQAMALIAGVLNLIGLLLADICYAIADPRITYS